MSKLKAKILQIEEMIIENPHMDLEEIAEICDVDVDLVQDVYSAMDPDIDPPEAGETDDGYALASAGFGTDEDYGDFGGDCY